MSNTTRFDRDKLPWFALRVKPNHEKRVSELIQYQGMDEFLPLYRVRRKWAQRIQNVDVPLFPGYVFSRFDKQCWTRIINTPGVIDAVRFGASFAAVDEEEIRALQLIQLSRIAVQPSSYLKPGLLMRVTAGPLAGVNGTLVEVKGVTRLLLSVTLLQRSVLVEIDRNWVTYDSIPQQSTAMRPYA